MIDSRWHVLAGGALIVGESLIRPYYVNVDIRSFQSIIRSTAHLDDVCNVVVRVGHNVLRHGGVETSNGAMALQFGLKFIRRQWSGDQGRPNPSVMMSMERVG